MILEASWRLGRILQLTLRVGSFYQPIGAEFTRSLAAEDVLSSAMDAKEFAAGVVANALKTKSTAYYWRGGSANIVWLISIFLPHTFSVKKAILVFVAL